MVVSGGIQLVILTVSLQSQFKPSCETVKTTLLSYCEVSGVVAKGSSQAMAQRSDTGEQAGSMDIILVMETKSNTS